MKNLILITGNDEFSIKKEAITLSSTLKEALSESSSFEIIDATAEGKKLIDCIGAFIDCVNTPSFFSNKRVVWFKNIPFDIFFDSEKNSKSQIELNDIFIKTIKREYNNENFKILLSGPRLAKKSHLYKFFKDNCQLIELNEISHSDGDYQINIASKIREFFKKEGKRIHNDAIEYIIKATASNSSRLNSELEKVSAYTDGKESVEVEDCKAICSKTYEMALWSYSEALATRNLKEALYLLNILLENPQQKDKSSPELPLLYSAVKKFKEILNIKDTAQKLGIKGVQNYNTFKAKLESVDKSLLPSTIASIHPFKAFKTYEQSLNFNENDLSDIFSILLETNIELVSGNQTLKLVLENLTFFICSKQSNNLKTS